ncbi:MAG: SIMPL domain-containing protein, partial [Candidatus Aenigmatarchaeota archaeon]
MSRNSIFGGITFKMAVFAALIIIILAAIAFKPAGTDQNTIYVSSYPEKKTIDVSGSSVLYAEPDKATLLFGYENQQLTAAEAQTQSAEMIEDIRNALEDKGLSNKDIVTSQYNVEPVRQLDEKDRTYDVIGYKTT